ncbi:hypothetical protein DUI87_29208 [Hirundo rustica rustica]|uniref:Uncharacterized protein n=1 Tax=Hirundo rustica rustica TaxID=333673 RepID=A0A3M0J0Q4_HIRRU|nr:hypothetical protein DUI87_29208 [Hirundo rustica rustica]
MPADDFTFVSYPITFPITMRDDVRARYASVCEGKAIQAPLQGKRKSQMAAVQLKVSGSLCWALSERNIGAATSILRTEAWLGLAEKPTPGSSFPVPPVGKRPAQLHIQSVSHLHIQSVSHLHTQSVSHLRTQSVSHLHTQSVSHLHIQSVSHLHIQALSHLHIQSVSHLHTQSVSHLHIQSVSYLHIQALSHLHIQSVSHLHTQSVSHLHIQSVSHLHTQSVSHLHIQSVSHLHIQSVSYLHIQSVSHLHIQSVSYLHIQSVSHLHIQSVSHLLIQALSYLHIQWPLSRLLMPCWAGQEAQQLGAAWIWMKVVLERRHGKTEAVTLRAGVGSALLQNRAMAAAVERGLSHAGNSGNATGTSCNCCCE